MSSRAKGRRSVNRAKEYYEERGWLVDEVEKTGRFRKNKDLFSTETFGGFDLVAIKRNQTLLIQVKTNAPPVLKNYKLFSSVYGGKYLLTESFTWYDRKGPVIHTFHSDGTVTRRDERK